MRSAARHRGIAASLLAVACSLLAFVPLPTRAATPTTPRPTAGATRADSTVTATVSKAYYWFGDVILAWILEGSAASVYLERRVDGGAWNYRATLGEYWNGGLLRDGQAYYSDWEVEPGHTYDYQLRVEDSTSVVRVGYASVVVPPRGSVATLIVRPNPSGPNPHFYATMPDARTDARIEIYDSNGRLMRSSGMYVDTHGTSGAFPYGSPGLRSGLYFARLMRDGRVMASTRFVVVK